MDDDILLALKQVIDPELGVDIVDLGLVYRAARTSDGIEVALTVTTPSCPLGEMLLEEAEQALRGRFAEAAESQETQAGLRCRAHGDEQRDGCSGGDLGRMSCT